MQRTGHTTARAEKRPARRTPGKPANASTSAAPSQSSGPVRTCVACRQPVARDELTRLVESPDGAIAVDTRGRAGGRGAWVHPTRTCIVNAAKRHAAERSLKVTVREVNADALLAGVATAMRRKIESLVGAAQRKGALGVGALVTSEMLEKGRVALVLVASDAGETSKALAEELQEPDDRAGARTVRTFGNKGDLGAMLGRGEVAIIAVTDPGIADELAATIDRLAGLEG